MPQSTRQSGTMADPLSATASVIAVVGAASQIAITLKRLWSLRDAPDVVQAIMNEVRLTLPSLNSCLQYIFR